MIKDLKCLVVDAISKIMLLSKFHFAIKYMKRQLEKKIKQLIQLKEHVKIM